MSYALLFGRAAVGGGTVALQPSEKFLLARKHGASLVAQRAYDLITRLSEPGHAMRRAPVFFFVSAFAAPVEDGGAALFPVAHGVPVAGFVGAQALMGTEAGVAPELGDLVEAGIDSGGDALPLRIARSNQQDIAPRLNVANQSADALDRIGGNLAPSKILELNGWLKSFCEQRHFPYVDYYTALVDKAGFLQTDLADDGLHPNGKGYRVMAPIALAAIDNMSKPEVKPAKKKAGIRAWLEKEHK